MQGARLVNKGGKNQQKQKQTNIRPGARNKLHSSRKKRNKSCLYFDASLIQSFNIKFNVRSLEKGHIFLVLLMRIYFQLSRVEKVLNCPQRRKNSIITLSESVQNKAELSRMLNIPRTTITSVLSKYRRTGTVGTLTRSGRKRSFTNRQKGFKAFGKSYRRLTLQDITAKLNECKTKTGVFLHEHARLLTCQRARDQ